MSTLGDVCGPQGEASSGTVIHGGYPHTQQSTVLNADWYAAHIRSCYDGDFYDGGTGSTTDVESPGF